MMLLGDRLGDRRVWLTRDDIEAERAEVAKLRFGRPSRFRILLWPFAFVRLLYLCRSRGGVGP